MNWKTLLILVLVLIAGILFATNYLWCCGDTKEKAYLAAMRYDLKLAADSERAYFQRAGTYTSTIDTTWGTVPRYVRITALEATRTGFALEAHHALLNGKRCVVFVGNVTRVPVIDGPAAAPDGELRCDKVRGVF